MEEGSSALFIQLHKLSSSSAATSEQTLAHVLETLWRTRKTGLRTLEKASIQSLLCLPSLEELDPVLACLRSLIRKCVHENLTADNLLKLFPPDLSLDLQSILVLLLQRYQNHWKDDASMDQPQCQRTSVPYQVTVGIPPSLTPFAAAELSSPLWPRQDDATACFNPRDVGSCTPIISDTNISRVAPVPLQQDAISPENMAHSFWVCDVARDDEAVDPIRICLKIEDLVVVFGS
ncbi:hypothetical protein BVC80_1417g19 [Macleaya cordata]|uniref:Uncharacterized protein n=1 Tax=Macleaya cordata TaxID=56857 RepID=A0A200Q5K6_MACCD|nr:hypothetical protein BVC80_1417g19 [Macleaya cordata]